MIKTNKINAIHNEKKVLNLTNNIPNQIINVNIKSNISNALGLRTFM